MEHPHLTDDDKDKIYFKVRYKVINDEKKTLHRENQNNPVEWGLAEDARTYREPSIVQTSRCRLEVRICLGDRVEIQDGQPSADYDYVRYVLNPCEDALRTRGYDVARL